MNKKLLALLIVGAFILSMAVIAGATTITDIFYPDDDDKYISNNSSVTIFHDLTANGFTPGLVGNPGVDTIISAWLDIYTYDDIDYKPNGSPAPNEIEKYKISLGDGTIDVINNSSASDASAYRYNFSVFTTLQDDGQIMVQINGQVGDFFFAKSELTAEWGDCVEASSVVNTTPEPGTMLLLGVGLAGVVMVRHRKARRK